MKHLIILISLIFSAASLSAQINPKHIYLNGKVDNPAVLEINSMGLTLPKVVVYPESYDSLFFDPAGNGAWELNFWPTPGFRGDAHLTVEYYEPTGIPGLFLPNYTNLHYRIKESKIDVTSDYAMADPNSAVEIDVLNNDTTTDGTLSLERIGLVEGGTASISNNKILFNSDGTSNSAFVRYFTKDSASTIESSNLYIAIENDQLTEDRRVSVDKLSSIELHLNSLNYNLTTGPSNGSLVQDGHIWIYTPGNGFTGTDNIVFNSTAGGEISYEISVLNKLDDKSFVRDDQYFVVTDGSLSFNVFDNDYYDNFSILDYSSELNYIGGGEFEYTPAQGFSGDKVFYYKIYAGYQFHTGNIYIHVDDFAPSSEYIYDFSVLNNHDLVINHEAPVSDYYFQIQNPALNGEVSVLDENDSVTLECDIIQGDNTIIYTPDPGFSGTDNFTIEFCTDTGICETVDITVNVLSSNYDECLCLVDCVYKGDNNQDGAVNLKDVLDLAVNIGEAGLSRSNDFDLIWTGQESMDWGYNQRGSTSDLKNGDANGNGFIEYDDLLEMESYYGRVHNFVPNNVGNLSSVPVSFVPQNTDVDSGEWLYIDIYAGSPSNPVLDIYGLSFSFNIDPEVLDSASVSFDLADDNFLVYNSPVYDFVKVPEDGRVDIAVSRLSRESADGAGIIATLGFIVEDEVDGLKDKFQFGYRDIPFFAHSILSVNEHGAFNRHPNYNGKVQIATESKAPGNTELEKGIKLFPNPATSRFFIESDYLMDRIVIIDALGRITEDFKLSAHTFNHDISAFEQGTYFIRISSGSHTSTLKLVKLD